MILAAAAALVGAHHGARGRRRPLRTGLPARRAAGRRAPSCSSPSRSPAGGGAATAWLLHKLSGPYLAAILVGDGRRKAGAPMSGATSVDSHDSGRPARAPRDRAARRCSWPRSPSGLAGCASQSPSMFQTHSAGAHDIAVLTYTMFAILSAVLITVWSLLACVVIRYRERPESEASQHAGQHDDRGALDGDPRDHRRRPVRPHHADHRQAHRSARTPSASRSPGTSGGGRCSYAGADFETANEIHLPAGTAVTADLLSADVIHSFWVPQLAGKVQMIPGTREPHQLPADHRRHLPRRVRQVLRHAARPHALPAHRAAAGAVRGLVRQPDEARGHSPPARRPSPAPPPSPACPARAATPSAGPA